MKELHGHIYTTARANKMDNLQQFKYRSLKRKKKYIVAEDCHTDRQDFFFAVIRNTQYLNKASNIGPKDDLTLPIFFFCSFK